jgi:hypothetical protein
MARKQRIEIVTLRVAKNQYAVRISGKTRARLADFKCAAMWAEAYAGVKLTTAKPFAYF